MLEIPGQLQIAADAFAFADVALDAETGAEGVFAVGDADLADADSAFEAGGGEIGQGGILKTIF